MSTRTTKVTKGEATKQAHEQAQQDGEALDLDRQGIKEAPKALKETHAPRSPDVDEPAADKAQTELSGNAKYTAEITKAIERLRKVADTHESVAAADIHSFITRVENSLRQVK